MDAKRWEQVRAVFDDIVELGDSDRESRLASIGATDPELRDAVDELLKADAQASARLAAIEQAAPAAARIAEGTEMLDAEARARLQAALGSTYRITRELGGGGMSRIYVAEELAVGREVVVKVLGFHVTEGISTRRFQREIHVAARLQHPHIVPLLSAGDANGLLYYTMPFVEGESLRHRLRREGPLPIEEVVQILRDVVSALAYAHRHGVVHRDIKPENVLLSEGGAVVADFGIAKALSASQTRDDATTHSHTITQLGEVLGTPRYMAPEQAAGEPHVDHRADIYALGVLSYEMLAGRPPFDSASMRQLMAAHVTEEPEPIANRRGDTPDALAALVMQCLKKSPAERPQSAEEVLHQLASVLTSPIASGARQRPHRAARFATHWRVATAAALLVAAAAVFAARLDDAVPEADARVIVVPFKNLTADRDLDALGVIVADWVTQGLIGAPFLTVHDMHGALAVAEALGRDATPAAVGRESGASMVVAGSYLVQGDSVRLSAQIIATADGRILHGIDGVIAPRDRPLDNIEQLRQRVMSALASLHDDAVSAFETRLAQPPTYDAYREYVEGLEAFLKTEWDIAGHHFLRAAALDSSFLTPRLWAAGAWVAIDNARADSILKDLHPLRHRLSPYDQARFDGMLAGRASDMAEAYRAVLRTADAAPASLDARREVAIHAMRVFRPREALQRLRRLDPSSGLLRTWGDYWNVVAWCHHMLGQYEEELVASRRGRRLYPSKEQYRFLELRALAALGRDAAVDSVIQVAFAAAPGQIGILGRVIASELLAHGHVESSRRLARYTSERLAINPPTPQTANDWISAHRHLTNLAGEREWHYAFKEERALTRSAASPLREAQDEWLHQRIELALLLGDPESAAKLLEQLRDSDRHRMLPARVAAAQGREADARAALGRGEQRFHANWGTLRGAALDRAAVVMRLGHKEEALAIVAEALSRGLVWDSSWGNDGHARPDLAPLWSDPRFRALIEPRG